MNRRNDGGARESLAGMAKVSESETLSDYVTRQEEWAIAQIERIPDTVGPEGEAYLRGFRDGMRAVSKKLG